MSKEKFEGATVEAALQLAAEKLGADIADLEYEIVEEKKDFWGTGDDTVSIEARVRAADPELVSEAEPAADPELVSEAEPAADPEVVPEAEPIAEPELVPESQPVAAPESTPEPVPVVESASGVDAEATADAEQVATDSAEPSKSASGGQVTGDEEVEPAVIAKLLDQIFHDMEFDCTVEIESQPDGFLATVVGDDKDAVLAGNGRCLSALELIANNAFRHRLPAGNKVRVDAGDFRSRRDEELSDLALQVAHSAKESGRTQETQPLNPYERRLVHLALAEDSAVTTKSRGSGFLKNVQVIPQGRGNRGRGRRR